MIDTPFIARRRKGGLIVGFVVVIALLGFSLYIAAALLPWGADSPLAPSHQWLGWVMVLLSMLALVGMIRSALRDPELFRFDHQGVTVRDWSAQTIPWSEVIGTTRWKVKQTEFIMLVLANPSRYPGRGWISKMKLEEVSGGHVPLAAEMSDRGTAEVQAAIDYFRKWNQG